MKHISIGKIKEMGSDLYHVSFFDNQVDKEVNKKEMFDLIQKHSNGFLNTLEASSLCVEYYPSEGSKHYIIVDTVIPLSDEKEPNEPIVYEETEYEYRTSHKLFYKGDSTRNIINERDYSFYDVIRSSAFWKKWVTKILILVTLSTIISSVFFAAFFINLSSRSGSNNNFSNIEIISLLTTIFFSLLASFSFLTTYVHLKRLIIKNDSQRYLMKWRRWYKSRLWSIILSSLFSFFGLFSNAMFIYSFGHNVDIYNFNQTLYIDNIIISIINISFLFIFLILTITILIFISFRKKYFLNNLFLKNEKKQFSKWLKYKMPNIQKNQNHKFLFDPNVSEVAVTKEIETSEKIKEELSVEDLKRYKRKIIQHFEYAFKAYVSILKQSKSKDLQ